MSYQLYKRENSKNWQVIITLGGETIRRSTGTSIKALAQEFAHNLYEEVYREFKAGGKRTWRWHDAVVKYLSEDKGKRNNRSNRSLIRLASPYFDNGRMKLTEISGSYIDTVLAEMSKGKTVATRNRYAQAIRAILNRAHAWEDDKRRKWLDSVPKITVLPERNERDRWLRWEEFITLIIALPDYLALPSCFAVFTGLREKNVTHLRWDQIDFENQTVRIHSSETKGGSIIAGYLTPHAEQVLDIIREELESRNGTKYPPSEDELTYVFCWQRRQLKHINTKVFRRERARVGLSDVWEHDLRRTWATWHLQSGTSIQELTKLGGWSSSKIVEERYAHLAPEDLREKAQGLRPPKARKK